MTLVIGVVDTPDWGVVGDRPPAPEDIRQVCLSAAQCFESAIVERPVEPICITPTRDLTDPPHTLFNRLATGQVAIKLSVRGCQWAQLVYQFAHEFCHVLMNFRHPKVHPTMWIEESLCEMSSLFALRAMASRWRVAPPYQHWAAYADALDQYANDRLAAPEHGVPAGVNFTEWLAGKLPMLEADPVRRDDNTVIARHLLLLFEADPETWRALRYLNLWSTLEDVTLATHFNVWRLATPPQYHAAVDRIERCLMGASPS